MHLKLYDCFYIYLKRDHIFSWAGLILLSPSHATNRHLLINPSLSKGMVLLRCSLVLFTCFQGMQPIVHGSPQKLIHLHQLSCLHGAPMVTGLSSMTTVRHTFGSDRILLKMLRWCHGGIMGTKSQQWETELSLSTTIPGITHTSLLLDVQCLRMKMKLTK